MSPAPMTCERCGDPLDASYSTTAYSGVGQALRIGPDGASCIFPLGGFVACSWNCLAILAAQRAGTSADAAVRIVAERERQVTQEGWSPEHDASHPPGDLARAGIHYAAGVMAGMRGTFRLRVVPDSDLEPVTEWLWPWDAEWWKPKNPDRDLIRAGALIAAEADRDPARRRAVSDEPF